SLKLLDESLPQSKIIGLVTQHTDVDTPTPDDIYKIGVAVVVLKLLRQANDSILIVVQALRRVALGKILLSQPYIRAEIDLLESTAPPSGDKEWEAALKNLRETAARLIELTPDAPEQAETVLMSLEDPGQLADLVASN